MNTQIITFQADEQCLVKTGGIDKYASDTASYIEAQFTLGENWSGYDQISAIWQSRYGTKRSVLDTEGVCFVPWEMLTKRSDLLVNLVGSIADGDVLTDRLTTFAIKALEISQDVPIDADTPTPITPSEYEQFVATVAADADRAEAAKLDARESAAAANDSALLASQSAQSASDSAESASQSAEQASQSAEEAEQASQSVLGLTATASVDSSVGTPSVAVTVETVGDHKVMDFDFHNLKGEQGEQGIQGEKGEQGERGETGASGADGFSPTVEVTPTTDGHEVTITDKDGEHTFEVLNGTVEDIYPFLPTDSASGSIASFSDGANNVPVVDLSVAIDPVQDLNGQDAPYPAGGGKNKMPPLSDGWVSGYLRGGSSGMVDPADAVNQEMTSPFVPIDSEETYMFSFAFDGTPPSYAWIGLLYYDENETPINERISTSTQESYSSTSPANAKYVRYSIRTYGLAKNIQLEQGTTATSYSPYSNICPISGWTGAVVQRTGKNLFNKASGNEVDGYFSGGSISSIIPSHNHKIIYIKCKPNTTYAISNLANNRDAIGYTTEIPADDVAVYNSTDGTVTTGADAKYLVCYCYNANSDTVTYQEVLNAVQIELGTTATAYEPYQGNTHSISWATEAGTVYGGTLDVTTGVLTVDRAMVTYDGSEDEQWAKLSSGSARAYCMRINNNEILQLAEDKVVISNYLPSLTGNDIWGNYDLFISGSSQPYIFTGIRTITTVAEWRTYLASNPLQVVYELATPQTYQLSATEVRTLLGDNNIWADTGSTEVTYRADIQKYIDKQISAVLNA